VTLLQLGDLEGSRSHLERSVAIREKVLGADHPETTKSLLSLAALEREMDNFERAVLLTRQVMDAHEKWLAPLLTTGSDAEKRLLLRTQRGIADWAITLHLRSSPSHQSAARDATRLALTMILRDKGRALDAVLAERGAAFRQTGQAAAPIQVEAVQAALPARTALIELFVFNPFDAKEKPSPWGEERYAAYVLRASGEPAAVDLGAARELDRVVAAFRRALADRRQDVREWARKLDALTMERIRPLLGDATRLVVSPDGELNLIPFAALVDPQDEYLIEQYDLSYVTSGRDLLREPIATGKVGLPLVVGGPDFGAVPSSSLGNPEAAGDLPAILEGLAGAAAEAVAIGKILDLSEERVLIGPAATEGAVKAAKRPRILHLATHGFFLSGLPVAAARESSPDLLSERANETRQDAYLKSALAFAGFNHRQDRLTADDGVLTALEILELDLRGTELVTLSACETGVGEARVGNGVFGLRRAFALAGARSLMTSLWQVADDATERLMISWYTQIQEGVPGAEALRQIQLAALRGEPLPATRRAHARGVRPGVDSKQVSSRHPYYWASFLFVESSSPTR
jgi:CHAT domain-containing protein